MVANPCDTITTKGTNTHTQNTTKDRVSSRHGETKARSKSKITSRGDNSADHTQHKKSRAIVKGTDINDLCSDSVRNTTTNTKRTGELHDTGADHGLEVADGARRHRRRP